MPVPVTGLQSGVAKVSGDGDPRCAVLTSGSAKCWGSGPVADGTAEERATPQFLVGLFE